MRAFWCDACDVEWADGVDYETCPRCDGELRVIGIAASPQTALPSFAAMTRGALFALIGVQAVFAIAAPHDFAYLRAILIAAQLGAVAAAISIVAVARSVRGLLTERVRIVHGLEHATFAVLAERGVRVASGITYGDLFELELPSESGAKATSADIDAAAVAAIARVHAGERELVFTRHCGTSLVVGWLLVALAIAGVGAVAFAAHVPHGYTFALTVALVAIARRATERIGIAAQRAFTVSPSFASARVVSVSREVSPGGHAVTYWVRVAVEPVASVLAESV